MPKLTKNYMNEQFVIGDSEEDSDWIRKGALSKFRQEELDIHKQLQAKAKLTTAISNLAKGQTYKIMRDGAYKGRLSFAPDVALSLSSQDVVLVNQIQKMIVNPVHWDGKDNPLGSNDYPQAVIGILHKLGYVLEQV